MAKSDGWFRKGTSGNPGGRPKSNGQAKQLARERAGEIIGALAQQTVDRRIAPKERRAAAKLLISIGFGPNSASAREACLGLGYKALWQALLDAEQSAARSGWLARRELINGPAPGAPTADTHGGIIMRAAT